MDSVDRTVARVRLQLVTMAPKKKHRLTPPAQKTKMATVTPTQPVTQNAAVIATDLDTVAQPAGAKATSKFDMLGFQKANADANTINASLLQKSAGQCLFGNGVISNNH